MESISSRVRNLRGYLYELTYPFPQIGYIEVEDMMRLDRKIRSDIDSLYPAKTEDTEEEALLCAVLLQAYGGLLCQGVMDREHRQSLLDRSAKLLEKDLSPMSRCHLLVSCYGMVYEPDLAREAHAIMEGWQGREQSEEERALVDMLRILEEV